MVETTTSDTNSIAHIVAVMSAKGGVGKSVVTALLAMALQRQGQRVGILDADLACPAIARMFGAESPLTGVEDSEVEPLQSASGIKMTSMNIFMEQESEPLIWRGPMVSSAMKQFYSEMHWGELDFLLVDVPPGTADVPLTVLQALPLDGVIIVSTPQSLARKVTQKSINLVLQNDRAILGVVENMISFTAPGGQDYNLYGPDSSKELELSANAPLLAALPLDARLAALCDTGRIEEYTAPACETLATNFLKALHDRQGASIA